MKAYFLPNYLDDIGEEWSSPLQDKDFEVADFAYNAKEVHRVLKALLLSDDVHMIHLCLKQEFKI